MKAVIRVQYERLPTVEVEEHEADEQGNVFTLLRPISYLGVIVPAGFKSDGASVPRVFWPTVFPNDDRKALFAAVFHDFLYRTHPGIWTRSESDSVFFELLRMGGVSYIRAVRAYIGVRIGGVSAWNAGGKKQ
jgi:hypothetical protein